MATSAPTIPVRGDNIALIFQEVLTVTVRLRVGRLQPGALEAFRKQLIGAVESAQKEGLRRGYTQEDVEVSKFAVVAFVDEAILNSGIPSLADWQRAPLQQHFFGTDTAGEIIFRNITHLLGMRDSEALADVLEVHQLVLALGLRGRFSASGSTAEIGSILQKIEEKIRRIRGGPAVLTWQPPPQKVVQATDPWIPIMKWVAISCCAVALLLFIVFKFSLSSAVTELSTLASQIFS